MNIIGVIIVIAVLVLGYNALQGDKWMATSSIGNNGTSLGEFKSREDCQTFLDNNAQYTSAECGKNCKKTSDSLGTIYRCEDSL